jgi:(p)ppGpp synthase/HD superfamily hydrolase
MMKYEIENYSKLIGRTEDMISMLGNYTDTDRELIEKAYHFTCHAHRNQKRKATAEPYVIHCVDVACYLMDDGAPAYVVAAGLLHDTVEDIEYTNVAEITLRGAFKDNKDVTDMVMHVTERNKDLPWIVRKRDAIEHVKHCDYNTKHLKCADNLSNIRSMLETNATMGSAMWKSFKGGLQGHKDNFEKLAKALEEVSETKTYMEFSGELEKFLKI